MKRLLVKLTLICLAPLRATVLVGEILLAGLEAFCDIVTEFLREDA